jgi:hypothetical protein
MLVDEKTSLRMSVHLGLHFDDIVVLGRIDDQGDVFMGVLFDDETRDLGFDGALYMPFHRSRPELEVETFFQDTVVRALRDFQIQPLFRQSVG